MELYTAERVVCRAEGSAADVERFGASLSSEQRALVTTFDTEGVKFTAWPELVRLFPTLTGFMRLNADLSSFPWPCARCPTSARSV